MLRILLCLLALMLSNLGYWEFFRSKYKLNLYFLPAFTIGVQFLVLFAAGLLNFLTYGAAAVFLCGLLLLVKTLREQKLAFFSRYINWGYGFLAVSFLLVFWSVRGQVVSGYDNFTHWALVVKNMLQTNRFPNFADSVIGYQSYPLGSSAYLYYVCTLVGKTEDVMLMAQGFMMLCMLLPAFAFAERRRPLCTVLIAIMANCLLCYNITLYDLLVDSLLPLTGMAACLFVYHNFLREDASEETGILCAIPLVCLTAQLKNSGIFFVIAVVVLLLAVLLKKKADPRSTLLAGVSPFVINFLWNRHCDYVFPSALEGFHALSTNNFSNTISQKSPEDIRFIAECVLNYVFGRQELRWLLVCVLILGITALVTEGRKGIRGFGAFAACAAGLYLLYAAGITGMYLFSMSLGEARVLASIDRYMKTMDIAIYYLSGCYALTLISRIEKPRKAAVTSIALTILALGCWRSYFGTFSAITQAPAPGRRADLQTLMADYGVPEKQSYFICIPADDSRYTEFVCIYLTDSGLVSTQVIDDPAKLEDTVNYNFFLNLDPGNAIIESWISQHYPENAGNQAFATFQ